MSEYPERLRRTYWRVREFLWFLWRECDGADPERTYRIGWRLAWDVAATAVPSPEQERRFLAETRELLHRVQADMVREREAQR